MTLPIDDDWREAVVRCLRAPLTPWERDWLRRLRNEIDITERQHAVLAAIERATVPNQPRSLGRV